MKLYCLITIVISSVFLLSCDDSSSSKNEDYKIAVESNTSWSGSFANRTVDGSGDKIVDIPDDPPQCAVVQKQTASGYLRVRVLPHGDWVETTAAYGLVTTCL